MFPRLMSRKLLPGRLTIISRPYIRGYWPEPITQPTLRDFLEECNYFNRPQKFLNIGKIVPKQSSRTATSSKAKFTVDAPKNIDDLIEALGSEVNVPPLDYDDILVDDEQLVQMAINHGIYRDLFSHYEPYRGDVRFTQEQAERLDKLVPHHWITDQPFARVLHSPEPVKPLQYFEPVLRISARFVNGASEDEQFAHTSYHGNIIQAAEASSKPSIAIDMRQIEVNSPECKKDSQFDNWNPGSISFVNTNQPINSYFTIALLNLDSLHPSSANLHWMVGNVELTKDGTAKYEELCDYLPVHGIRGFGYSRYVFLILQHESKIDVEKFKISGFSLRERKFDCKSFIEQNNQIKMLPVGLSWFQTTWDITSNKIFHDYLNMKAPVYELIQQKLLLRPSRKDYPGRVPFNIFLDYHRDKKKINEQVLLERLKEVDPFDYKDQYVPPKVPPTVFEDEPQPSWMRNVMLKKKNRVGYWRGLRPASATLPLDNNADLDYPIRPLESIKKRPPGYHNVYTAGKRKQIKDMPAYSKPIAEHEAVFIQEDHENHLDRVREMMKEFEQKEGKKEEKQIT